MKAKIKRFVIFDEHIETQMSWREKLLNQLKLFPSLPITYAPLITIPVYSIF